MAALGGRHLQYVKPGVMECNVGIQALWGLTTIAKRPGGKSAGTLKPSHIEGVERTYRHSFAHNFFKLCTLAPTGLLKVRDVSTWYTGSKSEVPSSPFIDSTASVYVYRLVNVRMCIGRGREAVLKLSLFFHCGTSDRTETLISFLFTKQGI